MNPRRNDMPFALAACRSIQQASQFLNRLFPDTPMAPSKRRSPGKGRGKPKYAASMHTYARGKCGASLESPPPRHVGVFEPSIEYLASLLEASPAAFEFWNWMRETRLPKLMSAPHHEALIAWKFAWLDHDQAWSLRSVWFPLAPTYWLLKVTKPFAFLGANVKALTRTLEADVSLLCPIPKSGALSGLTIRTLCNVPVSIELQWKCPPRGQPMRILDSLGSSTRFTGVSDYEVHRRRYCPGVEWAKSIASILSAHHRDTRHAPNAWFRSTLWFDAKLVYIPNDHWSAPQDEFSALEFDLTAPPLTNSTLFYDCLTQVQEALSKGTPPPRRGAEDACQAHGASGTGSQGKGMRPGQQLVAVGSRRMGKSFFDSTVTGRSVSYSPGLHFTIEGYRQSQSRLNRK